MNPTTNTPVLIIGAGLSGLTVAYLLAKNGIKSLLIEAKDNPGGRILSPQTGSMASSVDAAVDLGPSWFWPDQQAITALVKDVGLSGAVYEQVSEGLSVIEYANGSIVQSQGGVSMAGSLRISGGMINLVNKLALLLPPKTIEFNTVAQSVNLSEHGVVTIARCGDQTHEFRSQYAVLALPPRVVADTIDIQPAMTPDWKDKLRSVSTWMAAEAKFVATYTSPFWTEQGLSGDGMSQIGPLSEIHDASPANGGPHALFGFLGVTSSQRENNDVYIKNSAVDQISRMFGIAGASPLDVYYKDWAFDSFTATSTDRNSQRTHPNSTAVNRTAYERRLIWAGSEMAGANHAYAGYLDGAVESALQATQLLVKQLG